MTESEESQCLQWLAEVLSWAAAASSSLETAPDALHRLVHLASTNAVRDLDLPFSCIGSMLTILKLFMGASGPQSPLSSDQRDLYTVALAFLGIPELREACGDPHAGSAAQALAVSIRPRMFAVSEAGYKAREKATDAMAGVTATTATPDAHQPSRGSLQDLRAEQDAAAAAAAAAPARFVGGSTMGRTGLDAVSAQRGSKGAAAAAAVGGRSAAAAAHLDELQLLRALASWLHSNFVDAASIVEAEMQALCSEYAEACVAAEGAADEASLKERAAAVRTALQIADALLRGLAASVPSAGHMRVDGSGAAVDSVSGADFYSSPASAPLRSAVSAWMAALLPLHGTPGTVNEMAALLSVFHEPLVQCLFTLCGPALAPCLGGTIAAVKRVLIAAADGWGEATRGNSTKAVLLLHEVDQLLQFVARSSSLSGSGSSSAGAAAGAAAGARARTESAVAQLLPLVMPLVCEAITSDNSRVAQVALGLFKQDLLVDALLPPLPEANAEAAAEAAADSPAAHASRSPAEVTALAWALEPLMRALYRGGALHWNATVNKLTHTVLARLLERDAAVVRVAFAAATGTATLPSLPKALPAAGEMASSRSATSASTVSGAAAAPASGEPLAVDKDGFQVPPPRQPRARQQPSVGTGAVADASGASSFATADAAGSGSSGARPAPRPAPPVTITGVAPWAMGGRASKGGSIGGGVGDGIGSASTGKAQPPVTITGVAPWAQPSGLPRAGGLSAGAGAGPVRASADALLGSGFGGGTSAGGGSSGSKAQPPVTITGVAPWAVSSAGGASGSRPQPPVTVTGVAPWAVAASGSAAGSGADNASLLRTGLPRPGGLAHSHMHLVGSSGPGSGTGSGSGISGAGAAGVSRGVASRVSAVLAADEEGEMDDDAGAAVLHPPPEDRLGYAHSAAAGADTFGCHGSAHDAVAAFLEQLSPAPARSSGAAGAAAGVAGGAGSAGSASAAAAGITLDPSFRGGVTDLSGETAASIAAVAHADVLSPSPTLLPSLAFHDLVFGHELGAGSFSTVRFAKQIVRGALGSTWPQYAVKVISTSTMAALGYEASVRREIAALAVLTHPSITRLVSAFRWRDGAYLVLEYAPKGDLHGAMASLGSLAEPAARFLGGEILAALMAVHAAGFAFADCKPENVLLVEDGRGGTHAKLTDFGAARPISAAGQALVARSRRILADMRDGDWRARQGLGVSARDTGAAAAGTLADSASASSGSGSGAAASSGGAAVSAGMAEDGHGGAGASAAAPTAGGSAAAEEAGAGAEDGEEEGEEDGRLEGTEEYLAPELASGTGRCPSIASDAYALGVTLFQLLAGQLPDAEAIWAEQQAAAAGGGAGGGTAAAGAGAGAASASASASASGSASASSRHVRFSAAREPPFPAGFPEGAVALIRGLLHPDPKLRLGGGARGLAEVAEHPWFAPVLALAPASAQGLAVAAHAAAASEGAAAAAEPGEAALASSASQSLLRLYAATGPKIAAGKAAPAAADSAWSRRHNSTIWAPLPRSYLQDDDKASASSGPAGARARSASDLSVRDMLQLAVLPALLPHIRSSL